MTLEFHPTENVNLKKYLLFYNSSGPVGSSLWCNWRCNWETHGMNRARLRAELRNDVPMEWSQRNFQRPKLPKPECVWFNDRRVKKSHLKKKSHISHIKISSSADFGLPPRAGDPILSAVLACHGQARDLPLQPSCISPQSATQMVGQNPRTQTVP